MNGADAIDIIDRMLAAEKVLQRARAEEEKRERLFFRVKVRRCGDCDLWMKSNLCPKEKNVQGISRGPSMKALACSAFVPDSDYTIAVKALEDASKEA